MSEARVDRLEEDIREIKTALTRLEPMITRIDATLPHLATKAELAAPAAIVLAADAFNWDRYHERQDACRELNEAQRACAVGGNAACDQAVLDRLPQGGN